ncbi:radical SAM protein [Candidatus Micrarchaeota archaeon RBG_16_36_9]|nr:MAG: radical SAM protein [Candidatus Micrarchaeota archaeon RBG_16_36_9]
MESITKKSLLYKSDVEYSDFSINHVLGCSHGCKFPCYAMMMAVRFGWVKNYEDWRDPKIVSNALELLDKEIPKYKGKIKFVHLCFMTDPFMYKNSSVRNMTLKIIEKLNENNIRCTVLTKGTYPKDLTNKGKYGSDNEYGITLVSLDNKFKKDFEPYSAPYLNRIKSLKVLQKNGLKTWVSMEPYPTPNLVKQDLKGILNNISFVDRIIFGKLNYNTTSSSFKNNAEFYEECAQNVIKFCKSHNIDFHIKFGTRKKYNKNTESIFMQKY